MVLRIFNSNRRHFFLEAGLYFSILSLVACSQDKEASTDKISYESKPSQQIEIFQTPKENNQSNQASKVLDLKLIGVLITASGNNSAVISIGSASQVFTYRVGDEILQGINLISITTDEVIVRERGNEFRIAMTHALKKDQSLIGKLSQPEYNVSTPLNSLPPGMVSMPSGVDLRPSSNNEFRDAINQRFQK